MPAAALDETVTDIVSEILRNAPASVRACKTLIREIAGPVAEAQRNETARRIAQIRATPEAREQDASPLDSGEEFRLNPQGRFQCGQSLFVAAEP